jgi:hypothetical protein
MEDYGKCGKVWDLHVRMVARAYGPNPVFSSDGAGGEWHCRATTSIGNEESQRCCRRLRNFGFSAGNSGK